MICAVEHCTNRRSNNRYFAFPKDERLREKWVHFCQRTDEVNTQLERVCIDHFEDDDFERDLSYELGANSQRQLLKLKDGVVPSVFNHLVEFDFEDEEDDEEPEPVCYALSPKEALYAKEGALRQDPVDALLAEYDEKQPERQAQDQDSSDSSVEIIDEQQETEVLPADEIDQVVANAEAYLNAINTENAELKRQNLKLRIAARRNAIDKIQLEKELDKLNTRISQMNASLELVFSGAQLQKLLKTKRIVWPEKEMIDACKMFEMSPSVYHMLLDKDYPLPSVRVLQLFKAKKRGKLQQCNDPKKKEETHDLAKEQSDFDQLEYIDITRIDHNYVW